MDKKVSQQESAIPKLELEEFMFTPPGPMGSRLQEFMNTTNIEAMIEASSTSSKPTVQLGAITEFPTRKTVDTLASFIAKNEASVPEMTPSVEEAIVPKATEIVEEVILETTEEVTHVQVEEVAAEVVEIEETEELFIETIEVTHAEETVVETVEPQQQVDEVVIIEEKQKKKKVNTKPLYAFIDGLGLVPLKPTRKKK